MGRDSQTDIHGGGHGYRRSSLLRPARAVWGIVAGEGTSRAHQFQPVGGTQASGGGVDGAAVVAQTVLPGNSVAGRHGDEGVGRAGIQAVADHDPGFRPRINALHRGNAGDDGEVDAVGRHINVAEGVRRAPDVSPGSIHREGAVGEILAAGQTHCPQVLRHPRRQHVGRRHRAGRRRVRALADAVRCRHHVVIPCASRQIGVHVSGPQHGGDVRVSPAAGGDSPDDVVGRVAARLPRQPHLLNAGRRRQTCRRRRRRGRPTRRAHIVERRRA